MHVELVDERLDSSGVKMGVGVQDECVLAGAGGNATVRGAAVADVRRRSQQDDGGMISHDELGIFRVDRVVDDDHLSNTCGRRAVIERRQSSSRARRFVVDDDDVESPFAHDRRLRDSPRSRPSHTWIVPVWLRAASRRGTVPIMRAIGDGRSLSILYVSARYPPFVGGTEIHTAEVARRMVGARPRRHGSDNRIRADANG